MSISILKTAGTICRGKINRNVIFFVPKSQCFAFLINPLQSSRGNVVLQILLICSQFWQHWHNHLGNHFAWFISVPNMPWLPFYSPLTSGAFSGYNYMYTKCKGLAATCYSFRFCFVIVDLQLDNQLHWTFSDGSWTTMLWGCCCFCAKVKVSIITIYAPMIYTAPSIM